MGGKFKTWLYQVVFSKCTMWDDPSPVCVYYAMKQAISAMYYNLKNHW